MSSPQSNDPSKQITSPVPFLFLNGTVEEWHIIREFEMIHEKGISEVIVHPRYGLQVEYLSDGWFLIFGWCVREAKKHGIRVWIYDELNWPSGTAGMSIMKMGESYQSKYLAVEQNPLDQVDLASFQPGLCVVAANIEGGRVTKTRLIDDISILDSLTGAWRIFNCVLKHDPFYIDTLSWDAVNAFKKATYDEYYKRFGDEFGKTIRAMFTDEPSIYWVSVGYDDCNLPYTDDYFSTFQEHYGYECAPMIPYLFHPGREGMRFRADYWEHAGFLFNERYHGNLGEWCREHGVLYTGHNNHEEPLRYQIRFQGDMFGTMRAMDVPGVDHLGKQTLGNTCIGIVGHKICSSLAHISGKPRCLSESFGLMEWDTTYKNLKRVVDWQYALGINLLVPHALYHTISGTTKRESPPSFFYQTPHWDDFECFCGYLQRLEKMLTGGRHVCKVAIMYPSSGLWATYQTDRKTSEFEHIDNFLSSLCLELVKNQIDFDILDFRALCEAQLDDGKIKLADEAYEELIVPSTPYLRPAEVKRLTDIVTSGVSTHFLHKSMEPIQHNLPEGLRGTNFVRTEELVSFIDTLRRQAEHDIQITGGGADDIMIYRREKDGRMITFMLNRSEKHRKVTAMLKDYPDVAIYDQETDTYTKPEQRRAGPKTQIQLRFQPNQSYFLVSNVPDAVSVIGPSDNAIPIDIQNLKVSVPFNVASLYHFSYSRNSKEPHEIDVRTDPRHIPVNWTPNCPDWTEFAGIYEAEIEINAPTDGIRMVLDHDYADCEVFVNDTRVTLDPSCSPLSTLHSPLYLTDFQDVHAPIGHLLIQGTNRLRVISPTKLSEPLRLVGIFLVRIHGKSVTIEPQGQPNPFNLELDYPFYSGTVTYTCEFELDKKWDHLALNLHDVRDTATIRVNGKLAGQRLWEPYTFDISSFAMLGRNSLEIEVRNNMTNLLMGNPRPLGLQTMPTLSGANL